VHAHKLLFSASDLNSYTAIGFSDPDFLQGAITWRSDDVFTLWPDFWHLTLNVCQMSSNVTLSNFVHVLNLTEIEQSAAKLLMIDLAPFRRRYVTLWPWSLIPWPWMFVVDRVSCNQTQCQTWPKSNNPRLSYWSISTFSHLFIRVKIRGWLVEMSWVVISIST